MGYADYVAIATKGKEQISEICAEFTIAMKRM